MSKARGGRRATPGFLAGLALAGLLVAVAWASPGASAVTQDNSTAAARQVPVGDFPSPMVRQSDRLYVGNSLIDQVKVVDIGTPGEEHVVETIDTPVQPIDLTIADEELYVLDQFHQLYWRPLAGGEWSSIDLQSGGGEQNHWGHGTTLFPHGDRMFVLHWENDGRVSVVDLNTHTVADTITDINRLPNHIVFLGNRMIVLSIGLETFSCLAPGPHFSVYDLTTLDKVFTQDVSGEDCAVTSALVGGRYYIAFNNTIREYDPATGAELNRVSRPPTLNSFLEHIVVRDQWMYLTTSTGDTARAPADLSHLEFLGNVLAGGQVWHPPVESIALDESASRLFVANRNDDTVSIVDLVAPPPPPPPPPPPLPPPPPAPPAPPPPAAPPAPPAPPPAPPPPIARPAVVRCVVPNVKRKTVARARRLLASKRCALGRIKRAYSTKVTIGRVISQSRRPGVRVGRGTRVNVVVSRGKRRIQR